MQYNVVKMMLDYARRLAVTIVLNCFPGTLENLEHNVFRMKNSWNTKWCYNLTHSFNKHTYDSTNQCYQYRKLLAINEHKQEAYINMAFDGIRVY